MEVSPNFYNYNYYATLSDTQKVAYNHSEQSNDQSKLNLHDIRQILHDKQYTDVIMPEWIINNDRPNYTLCTNSHVTDNDTKLEENKKISLHRKIMMHNNYIDEDYDTNDNIRYYLNSHGFRCEEFSDTECIAYIGCSHTFGTGVTHDEIWPELVSKKLNMRSANLGVPAVGIDYFNLYMNLFFKAEIKNCKAIVVMLPPSIRTSFFYNWQGGDGYKPGEKGTAMGQYEWMDGLKHYSTEDLSNASNMTKQFENCHKEVLQHTLLNLENCFDRDLTSISTIQNVAKDLNIPCLVYSSYYFTNERIRLNFPLDFGRDCAHAGRKSHASMAEQIVQDLKQQFDK